MAHENDQDYLNDEIRFVMFLIEVKTGLVSKMETF